jgi:hypothetical protein
LASSNEGQLEAGWTNLDDDARQCSFQTLEPSKLVFLFDIYSQSILLRDDDHLVLLDAELGRGDERSPYIVEREFELSTRLESD